MIRSNSVPVRWQDMTRLSLLPAVLLLFAAGSAFGDVQYAITDLGTLGGTYSYAYGINDSGQVVGESITSDSYIRAFLYSGSRPMQDLGTLGGASSRAFGINNSGQVVGTARLSSGRDHAFLYSGSGPMQDLGTLGTYIYSNSEARGINNSGQVVGGSLYTYPPYDYRAFLYSGNGPMIDLGKPVGSTHSCEARAINDSGQIVGSATYHGGYGYVTRAFFYGGDGGPMKDLGTLHETNRTTRATAINNSGQVVGSSTATWYPDSYASHAFLYSGNGPMQDLGTLTTPNLLYASSSASGINDSGHVVGSSTPLNGNYPTHAFLYTGDGPMKDLNDLVAPSSGWTLTKATAINEKRQIVGYGTNPAGQTRAFLLTPLNPASRSYFTPDPVCIAGPTDRLARWDGENWVSVSAGEISGNVHVLVHGWAPGQRQWVNDNGGSDARVWNSSGFDSFTELASAISAKPGEMVLAYSWIDQSATDGYGFDYSTLNLYAADSQKNTSNQGGILYSQLKAAIGLNETNLQLVGHSHGAKVATLATKQLNKSGIFVDQLTLFDSPEGCSSASNSLYGDLADISIGTGTDKTFVDNYITTFSKSYGDNVINVKLDGPYNPVDDHGYPINWYARSASDPNWDHVGLDWSPLTYNGGQSLTSNDWIQIWRNISGPGFNYDLELNLEAVSLGTTVTNIVVGAINGLQTLFQTNNVTGLVNGYLSFTKESPAFWDSTFIKNEGDIAIQFNYEFIQPGEGDQLAVWIDDEMMFVVTGLWAGTAQQIGAFDISGLEIGSHTMTVALHDYGTAPAQFCVGDFRVISVPEPSTILLLFAGAVALAAFGRQSIIQSLPGAKER